jgi:hypothetical protein
MTKLATLAVVAASLLLVAADRPSLSPADLRPVGEVALSSATHDGRKALRATDPGPGVEGGRFIMLPGGDFADGVVRLKVSGQPSAAANAGARGFVGVMVRSTPDGAAGELFYVRPTNGRADDQERRNHAVQYVSPPEWTWQRMRRETPSRYESYADMEPARRVRQGPRGPLDRPRHYRPLRGCQHGAAVGRGDAGIRTLDTLSRMTI